MRTLAGCLPPSTLSKCWRRAERSRNTMALVGTKVATVTDRPSRERFLVPMVCTPASTPASPPTDALPVKEPAISFKASTCSASMSSSAPPASEPAPLDRVKVDEPSLLDRSFRFVGTRGGGWGAVRAGDLPSCLRFSRSADLLCFSTDAEELRDLAAGGIDSNAEESSSMHRETWSLSIWACHDGLLGRGLSKMSPSSFATPLRNEARSFMRLAVGACTLPLEEEDDVPDARFVRSARSPRVTFGSAASWTGGAGDSN
mmetsp:Transcript_26737/g.62298  ORF Transcript_26737/g.62298 Transcript_26737/m.62298 type:complete len:259 (-) Transcript_26737:65-841(-)